MRIEDLENRTLTENIGGKSEIVSKLPNVLWYIDGGSWRHSEKINTAKENKVWEVMERHDRSLHQWSQHREDDL